MNLTDAQKCATLCRLVYDGDPDVLATVLGATPHVKSVGDLFCAISDGDVQYVILRGTVGLGSWILDLEAEPVALPGFPGRVHRGFAKAFGELEPWLDLAIANRLTRSRPIQVTGHSLGGALATLISYYLHEAGYELLPVMTFGSPRVGSPAFVAGYELPQWRVVNDLDPVPHVPSLWHYAHVGEEVRLPEGSPAGPWRELSGLWQHARNGIGATAMEAVKDHQIQSYCDGIVALAQEKSNGAA